MSPNRETVLDSPALGTGLSELVKPCGDALRPADPGRVSGRPTLALTFSGGGFRATLAALGVARYLADIGRLADVRFVSSVSGGSIANGVLATQWTELRKHGFSSDALDELVVNPIVDSISRSSLKYELLRNAWRAVGPHNRTHVLARCMDRRFFHGRTLASLDPECRFVINAANIVTGVRFAFERDVIGDYVTGLAPSGERLPVAFAAAASAAVPGAFAPLPVPDVGFPCPHSGTPLLLDGGTYDNTGLQTFDGDQYADLFLVAMNAGGVFTTGGWGGVPFVKNLMRANSLLYRQSTGLRTRWMVDRFKARESAERAGEPVPSWGRLGVLMALASDVEGPAADQWRASFPEHRDWQGRDLAFVPTVFDRLDRALCRLLVYRGWWLTGATIAAHHPNLAAQPSSAPPLD
ncbi:MAG TPA: patatin-like phospholipase family protein [Solirubrobacteraceae bacterium]|jgi:NTE family protein|nr:patatin-like phospholipase family protein [Solirubrobacteraceae bacterium]